MKFSFNLCIFKKQKIALRQLIKSVIRALTTPYEPQVTEDTLPAELEEPTPPHTLPPKGLAVTLRKAGIHMKMQRFGIGRVVGHMLTTSVIQAVSK